MRSLLKKVCAVYGAGGLRGVSRKGAGFIFFWGVVMPKNFVLYYVYSATRRPRIKSFALAELAYDYFYHSYNFTWSNERIVEIPLVLKYVQDAKGGKILEVGNVLAHYIKHDHEVVDKYEVAPGIVNVDVVDFRAPAPYDLIVGISTLEHVDRSESFLESQGFNVAIRATDSNSGFLYAAQTN